MYLTLYFILKKKFRDSFFFVYLNYDKFPNDNWGILYCKWYENQIIIKYIFKFKVFLFFFLLYCINTLEVIIK